MDPAKERGEADDFADDEAIEQPGDDEDEISLEDLGAAYALAVSNDPDSDPGNDPDSDSGNDPANDSLGESLDRENGHRRDSPGGDSSGSDPSRPSRIVGEFDGPHSLFGDSGGGDETMLLPSPEAIVEAALFVGHPSNEPLTATRIASLMRDVTPEEVAELIEKLNDSYRQNKQAIRIIREQSGFVMTLSPEASSVRAAFVGKVRETKLNQPAIDVLALVAYQPGITAAKIDDQRGRESAAILNQLVRRQLLMVERIKPDGGGRASSHYYPTERFLYLFEMESLQDLPLVEESLQ